jgi:hypothetical protein
MFIKTSTIPKIKKTRPLWQARPPHPQRRVKGEDNRRMGKFRLSYRRYYTTFPKLGNVKFIIQANSYRL